MADSAELNTILSCATSLETAFRKADSDLVHFLLDEGFISEDVHDHILNPGAILDEGEELVMLIQNKVEQDPNSYHVLVHYFMISGEPYQAILHTLMGEYVTQRRNKRNNTNQGTAKTA